MCWYRDVGCSLQIEPIAGEVISLHTLTLMGSLWRWDKQPGSDTEQDVFLQDKMGDLKEATAQASGVWGLGAIRHAELWLVHTQLSATALDALEKVVTSAEVASLTGATLRQLLPGRRFWGTPSLNKGMEVGPVCFASSFHLCCSHTEWPSLALISPLQTGTAAYLLIGWLCK